MTDFRSFKGTARPLDDLDLPRIGYRIKVGEDEIHAVMDVEAAGGAWDSQGRPKMLFEPHRFYKNLTDAGARARAVAAGLAYPKWGEQPYPRDSYPRLIEAMKIDETAALKSASWGLGQVLGENFAMVGFDTVQAFVLGMLDDADAHLDAMVSFIISAHLDDEIRSHNWAAFARGYNGPQYAKNDYDTKLAKAFAKWSGIRDTPWSPATAVAPAPAQPSPPIAAAEPVPLPANPSPTPVEQASKSVGAGKWTAIVGAAWTAISAFLIATPSIPEQYRDPVMLAGVGTLLSTLASIIGAYSAPANAVPVKA
jgi:hypothetical protein